VRPEETQTGGPDKAFLETAHDLVAGLRGSDPQEYRAALERFGEAYWKPIYAYVRAAWAKGNEDAKDLTQAFFLWVAEGDALRRYDPTRGSFRGYLKVLLRSFVGHRETALARLKRGGGRAALSIEETGSGLEEILPDPKAVDAEEVFERTWRVTILQHAIRRLKSRYQAENRIVPYLVFESYDLVPEADRPTYRDLAARHHLDEATVKRYLLELRDGLRAEVRAELVRTGDESAIAQDWESLFR
jgi:RNA polymerase sigma-70 factor (ECF subfamily)